MRKLWCFFFGCNMIAKPMVIVHENPKIRHCQIVFGRKCTHCDKFLGTVSEYGDLFRMDKIRFVAELKGCVVMPWFIFMSSEIRRL